MKFTTMHGYTTSFIRTILKVARVTFPRNLKTNKEQTKAGFRKKLHEQKLLLFSALESIESDLYNFARIPQFQRYFDPNQPTQYSIINKIFSELF